MTTSTDSGHSHTVPSSTYMYHNHVFDEDSENTGGSHTHNVTASPTPDVEDTNENEMIEILSDTYIGLNRIVAYKMPEFSDKVSRVEFPADKSDERVVKSLKQIYHDLLDAKEAEKVRGNSIGALMGRKVKWDKVKEKNHLLEQTLDDGMDGWRANMEKTISEGTAHPDDLKRYNNHLADREKAKKLLKLDKP
jgi:hypothetical protein